MKPLTHNTITNAGAYNRRIEIFRVVYGKDADGFPTETRETILRCWASVKTTRGMTIIVNDSDFEKAYTNFTIRYPRVPIDREMFIDYRGKTYSIQYVNNINEESVELELQAKEVTH